MADQPKFFRVAVEGDTTDGRKITRQDILDCAETFNPELYGVRVNLEHYRGIVPGGPFDMLGDVTAVKAEEINLPVGTQTQKVMALFAAIKPLETLLAYNKKRQKIFSSIEIGANCRGTGKAYLVGMAVTDSPASFGTATLEFAAQHPAFLASRKSAPDSLIVTAHEVPAEVFATEEAPASNPDPTGVFASIKAFFDGMKPSGQNGAQQQSQEEPKTPPAPAAPEFDGTSFAAFGAILTQMATSVTELSNSTKASIDKLTTDVKAVTDKLEATPAPGAGLNANGFMQRTAATGGNATGLKAEF